MQTPVKYPSNTSKMYIITAMQKLQKSAVSLWTMDMAAEADSTWQIACNNVWIYIQNQLRARKNSWHSNAL